MGKKGLAVLRGRIYQTFLSIAHPSEIIYDSPSMGNFFKAIAAGFVVFLIFFGVPVLVYSSFQRFLGMVPPAQLTETAIYQLASLKGAEAFILVILYLMIIERRRGKEVRLSFFLAALLFIQGGLVAKLWTHLTLQSPPLYTTAGIVESFISYGLSAWFLAKLYKSTSSLMVP